MMPTTVTHWIKALVAAFVSGFSNSFLNVCGITGANMVGMQIPQLTPKQVAVSALFGGVVGAVLYLKQSPVPPDTTATTPSTQPKP